ncbi:MAG: LPS export ABC transporter periplasmic protein LptC [Bacteroidota bacterium]
MKISTTILFFSAVMLLASCSQKENPDPINYTGPVREGENVTMLYAEKDMLKMKLIGKRVLEFENGDREFPEGLFIEFYNEQGKLTSTLTANHAYFFKHEYQWRGRGHVEVKNLETFEQLNTEELYWKPDTKRIFTDKFVTIKTATDVIYGTDLDAAQDMSQYTLRNTKGSFEASEENEDQ